MDWDTWFFEIWEPEHPGMEPTYEEYQDWLFDKADLALGNG